ncbi:glycine/betaine ABC transporter permease [Streptomyces sulfonofaciens]|uniref:Glycine/betaine ABC transporter permease n=1 Tax=Streptomyces sulfonofaciens TaxID=68272 RepID=A0A919FZN1_9ACTN|nr:ABC transporter permease/substrate binding protein [Streptomyces sulfonofaciens]GHH75472.1 glycine/betaine ABC transporter permease [Streptomyces sulfonofaciens]
MPRLEFGHWVEDVVDWLQTHLSWLFDLIKTVLDGMYHGVDAVLGGGEPLLMAGILAVIAFWLRGLLPGVLAFVGFALIDSLALWDDAMSTLSLVVVAAVITVVIAVPVGVWAARNSRVSAAVRPVLDVMQTMPAFVYLIPGVMFFGVGTTPGIIATIVFAMPPGVRMTELGIRQVDEELVEAADAFGTSPRDTLTRVQLPLALPTIMAGVNQVIMLALSMVVIGGMAGAGGLGEKVYAAITQLQVGLAAESGVAVVILAMYLDRMTGALNQRVSPLGRRAAAKAAAAVRRFRFAHYKPGTAVALVGVVVLALVAGGLNLADSQGGGARAGAKVGAGKTVNMGYIPWDEGIATTFLWKELLEQRGYTTNLKQLDAGPLYSGVARGDIDFQTDAWLPTTHKAYWDKYRSQLDDLGGWYGPTSLELTVPSYVKGVDSLADLKGKSGTFGGKIIGIEASAGEMATLNDKVLKAYGLDGEYKVVSSSTSSMLAELDRSIKKKEPIVVTLWSPHWAYGKYDLKKLADPKGAWGKGEQIHTVAHKGFARKDPTVANWLKHFKLTEQQLTSLENEIQGAGEGHEQDGVKAWLKKNPGLVDKLAPVPGGGGAQQGRDAGKTVNLGYFPWDEAIASTYLWENVLEDRGYRTNVKQLDPGPLYTALSRGDMDVQLDSWLPTTHKQYWDRYKDNLDDVGSWYGPTSLELTVPSYVKGVDSLADLKGKSGTFGGKIIGIEASAGEMATLNDKVLKAYGLDGEYKVVSSSTSSMLAELDRSIEKKEPVVVTLWTPHWAYGKYDLKKLADPKGAWGKGERIHIVAHKGFDRKFPEFDGWLKHFKLSEGELASLEVEIQKGGAGNEKQSARHWLDAHPGMEDRLAPVG